MVQQPPSQLCQSAPEEGQGQCVCESSIFAGNARRWTLENLANTTMDYLPPDLSVRINSQCFWLYTRTKKTMCLTAMCSTQVSTILTQRYTRQLSRSPTIQILSVEHFYSLELMGRGLSVLMCPGSSLMCPGPALLLRRPRHNSLLWHQLPRMFSSQQQGGPAQPYVAN